MGNGRRTYLDYDCVCACVNVSAEIWLYRNVDRMMTLMYLWIVMNVEKCVQQIQICYIRYFWIHFMNDFVDCHHLLRLCLCVCLFMCVVVTLNRFCLAKFVNCNANSPKIGSLLPSLRMKFYLVSAIALIVSYWNVLYTVICMLHPFTLRWVVSHSTTNQHNEWHKRDNERHRVDDQQRWRRNILVFIFRNETNETKRASTECPVSTEIEWNACNSSKWNVIEWLMIHDLFGHFSCTILCYADVNERPIHLILNWILRRVKFCDALPLRNVVWWFEELTVQCSICLERN